MPIRELMPKGLHFLPQGMPGRNHEAVPIGIFLRVSFLNVCKVALELGMGRGRVGLHLFLAGATVLGRANPSAAHGRNRTVQVVGMATSQSLLCTSSHLSAA